MSTNNTIVHVIAGYKLSAKCVRFAITRSIILEHTHVNDIGR